MNGKSPLAHIPEDTYHAARQVYSPSHIYLLIGDQYDELFETVTLRLLDPFNHQAEETLARLALVTAFQYAESIPDIVASDATRRRIDWKYALHLPIHHHGIFGKSLCDFRNGISQSQTALGEFDHLLFTLSKAGLFTRTSSESMGVQNVLQTVCQITCLNQQFNSMKTALSIVAATAPDWLRSQMLSHWYGRYKTGQPFQLASPSQQNFEEEAKKIRADLHYLVTSLSKQNQEGLLEQPEIKTIIELFEKQFIVDGDQIRWQMPGCSRCAGTIQEETLS